MDVALGICLGIGLSAACGFRVFVPMFIMSLASKAGYLDPADGFGWMSSWGAVTAFGTATVLETGAYYIPWLDNLLDSVTTPAAIIAGAVATASVVTGTDPLIQWSAAPDRRCRRRGNRAVVVGRPAGRFDTRHRRPRQLRGGDDRARGSGRAVGHRHAAAGLRRNHRGGTDSGCVVTAIPPVGQAANDGGVSASHLPLPFAWFLATLLRHYSIHTLDYMAELRFEWNIRKSEANKRKHGVTFEEARTVFFDDHALLNADPDHSDEEDRFVLLGMSSEWRLLLVCHCYRERDDCIRLISARKATRAERKQYNDRKSL